MPFISITGKLILKSFSKPASMTKLFKLNVADSILKEINLKVKNYPWNLIQNVNGWEYGTNCNYLKNISKYWASNYNWKKNGG